MLVVVCARFLQVNGVPVLGMQYSEVVAAIKAGGDETKLLVVDAETEEYFKTRNVQPTEYHLTGNPPLILPTITTWRWLHSLFLSKVQYNILFSLLGPLPVLLSERSEEEEEVSTTVCTRSYASTHPLLLSPSLSLSLSPHTHTF